MGYSRQMYGNKIKPNAVPSRIRSMRANAYTSNRAQLKPEIIPSEYRMIAINNGMITGKPNMAIIPEFAPVFHAIALMSPRVVVIPKLPSMMAEVKSTVSGSF